MTQRLGDSVAQRLGDSKNKLYEKDTLNIISRIDYGVMRTEDDG